MQAFLINIFFIERSTNVLSQSGRVNEDNEINNIPIGEYFLRVPEYFHE